MGIYYTPKELHYRGLDETQHRKDHQTLWLDAGKQFTYTDDNRISIPTLPTIDTWRLDEACYSSMIEGSTTTREDSISLICGAAPKSVSDEMVINLYKATWFTMSRQTIFDIQEQLTGERGFRDAPVYIRNNKGFVIYQAPPWEQVPYMMDKLLDTPINSFIDVIMFHFVFAYIHPFFDGNGRTARLTSLLLARDIGIDLGSLSKRINDCSNKYYKAFLQCEQNEHNNVIDCSYFLHMIINLY